MIKLLIVCSDKFHLIDLASFLKEKENIDISWASNAQVALNIISDNPFDLVIADEQLSDMTGLGFVQKLVKINPMVNSALVSTLSHDKFHEMSEGLGVLTQLPKKPDIEHANDLLEKLKRILN